ncbi:efflux RND transporter permease subunit [Pseudomonas aeruginosa]
MNFSVLPPAADLRRGAVAADLIGGAILFQLPISEYPEVVPPMRRGRANFPGANPKSSARPSLSLEQAITGVENMLYMSSQSTSIWLKLT